MIVNCFESVVEIQTSPTSVDWRWSRSVIQKTDCQVFESINSINQYILSVLIMLLARNTICDDGSSGEDKSMSDFVTKSHHCTLTFLILFLVA